MGILDWLRSATSNDDDPAGMSRRDFFARVAGRAELISEPSPPTPEEPPADESAETATEADPSVLHTFHVARFPYHDGPVLVPILKAGDVYRLAPEPPYSREPTGLRIERGRDHLGFVPDDIVEDLLARMKAGETLECRAVKVDPAAELQKVLLVAVRQDGQDGQDDDGRQDEQDGQDEQE